MQNCKKMSKDNLNMLNITFTMVFWTYLWQMFISFLGIFDSNNIFIILFGYVLLTVNCGCYRAGSRQMTCDPKTKACDCLSGVGGQKCDKCKPGYWGLNPETRSNYTPGCASMIKISFYFYSYHISLQPCICMIKSGVYE